MGTEDGQFGCGREMHTTSIELPLVARGDNLREVTPPPERYVGHELHDGAHAYALRAL